MHLVNIDCLGARDNINLDQNIFKKVYVKMFNNPERCRAVLRKIPYFTQCQQGEDIVSTRRNCDTVIAIYIIISLSNKYIVEFDIFHIIMNSSTNLSYLSSQSCLHYTQEKSQARFSILHLIFKISRPTIIIFHKHSPKFLRKSDYPTYSAS